MMLPINFGIGKNRRRSIPAILAMLAMIVALAGCTVAEPVSGPREARPSAEYRQPDMTTNGVPISIRPTADQHGMVQVGRYDEGWGGEVMITLHALDGDGERSADWVIAQSAQGIRSGGWRISRDDRFPMSVNYDLLVDEPKRMGREYVVLVASVDGDEVTRLRHRIRRNH